MVLSAFEDRARAPGAAELARVLGPAQAAWSALVARVREAHPPIEERWSFGGAKFGWSMRLVRGERVVLYLTPQARRILVGVVLGEKAVERATRGVLPAAVRRAIEEAPRYAEGRGLRLTLTKSSEVAAVVKLVAAKLAT